MTNRTETPIPEEIKDLLRVKLNEALEENRVVIITTMRDSDGDMETLSNIDDPTTHVMMLLSSIKALGAEGA